MSDFFLYVDSSTSVTLRPEYDYKNGFRKIESRFRSKAGPEYAFKWAEFRKVSFEVKLVTSADAAQITSWWLANTELKFQQGSGTPVTVRLVGNKSPLQGRSKPYAEAYEGTIELETF